MNFLDTYDLTGTNTPPQNQPDQSLNEEVSQVIGQLGRFWGGVRKQSQTALETARKDFSEVVTQAQKELSKLSAEALNETSPEERNTSNPEFDPQRSPSTEPEDASTPTGVEPSTSSTGIQTLFSRLQSALPPNVVSTVQNNLPDTIKHASENIDLGQLRTTLSTEFQRVQGVTRIQAEEYVHKSEALLREAMKEAGGVLREAVKVIPPEEAGSSSSTSGIVWDGTDMWMLPSDPSDSIVTATGKGKGKDSGSSSGRQSGETQRAVATRAESLLKRLKHDPEIIKHDPEADQGVRELYVQWLKAEVDVKDGGMDEEDWTARIARVLSEPDAQALQATREALVSAEMTEETFWKRFFFRVHQIQREEEKRKALLQGSTESEEDFSWEDEEEDTTSPTFGPKSIPPSQTPGLEPTPSITLLQSAQTEQPSSATPKPAEVLVDSGSPSTPSPSSQETPANTSPRESSEDSYDLVSSGNVSASGEEKASEKKNGDADDADSDWE